MTDKARPPLDQMLEILDDLRATEEVDRPEDAPFTTDTLNELLAGVRLHADSAAAAAVDHVVAGVQTPSLSLARRTKLLDSLDQALGERRRDNGPLQSVLRRRRYDTNESLRDLSFKLTDAVRDTNLGELLNGTPQALEALETGVTAISEGPGVVTIAAWAALAGLTRDKAQAAYLRSIEAASEEAPLRSAAGASIEAVADSDSTASLPDFLKHFDTVRSALERK